MYKRTTTRDIALTNGYIGEILMRPKPIARDIGLILGKRYVYFIIYFYGTPDEHLRKKFKYDLSQAKAPGTFHPSDEKTKESIKEGVILK